MVKLRLTDTKYTIPNKPNRDLKILQKNIKYRKDLYLYLNINRGLTKYQIQELDKIKKKTYKIQNQQNIKERYYSKEINREIIRYNNGDIITRLITHDQNNKEGSESNYQT